MLRNNMFFLGTIDISNGYLQLKLIKAEYYYCVDSTKLLLSFLKGYFGLSRFWYQTNLIDNM
jgi:hypothetical protein